VALWQVLLQQSPVLLLLELPACLEEPRVEAFLQQALQHRTISED